MQQNENQVFTRLSWNGVCESGRTVYESGQWHCLSLLLSFLKKGSGTVIFYRLYTFHFNSSELPCKVQPLYHLSGWLKGRPGCLGLLHFGRREGLYISFHFSLASLCNKAFASASLIHCSVFASHCSGRFKR